MTTDGHEDEPSVWGYLVPLAILLALGFIGVARDSSLAAALLGTAVGSLVAVLGGAVASAFARRRPAQRRSVDIGRLSAWGMLGILVSWIVGSRLIDAVGSAAVLGAVVAVAGFPIVVFALAVRDERRGDGRDR